METPDATNRSEPQPVLVKGIESLLALVRKPKQFAVAIGSEKVLFDIHALTQKQWAEIMKIGADLKAPPKFKDAARTQPDGFDEEDPTYSKEAVKFFRQRQIAAITMAVVGIEIPGGNIEQKVAWAEDHLPPQLIDALWTGVRGVTTDPVGLGYFTSSAS